MAAKSHPVPFVEGYVPGTPKTKKEKSWVEELNELGNFLLGPHGSQLFEGLATAAEFTPGAAVRDTMDASKTVSEGVMNANPWETGIGLAGILAAFLPGKSTAKEFDLIHGSQHKFKPEGNEIYGRFDLGKVLTGEGTNYEGKGIYATDPKATGVARTYAHMGDDVNPPIFIGDDPINSFQKDLNTKWGTGTNEFFNDFLLENQYLVSELEKMINFNNQVDKPKSLDKYILDILAEYNNRLTKMPGTRSDPELMRLFSKNAEDYMTNFRGKTALMHEPGGWIYDFKVHDNPDNFINLHVPIAYQDDKIIEGFDNWLKEMPLSNKARTQAYGINEDAFTNQEFRDALRKKYIDDQHVLPRWDLTEILSDKYINEHMDIIKDQGILGAKWFSSHGPGRQYRDDVDRLFKRLGDAKDVASFGTADKISELEKQAKELTDEMNNMPITDANMTRIWQLQGGLNYINARINSLKDRDIDDLEQRLFNIYHDPNLAYNYTINDPKKTTIVNRKFIPK